MSTTAIKALSNGNPRDIERFTLWLRITLLLNKFYKG
jgi:hypothetical protein